MKHRAIIDGVRQTPTMLTAVKLLPDTEAALARLRREVENDQLNVRALVDDLDAKWKGTVYMKERRPDQISRLVRLPSV